MNYQTKLDNAIRLTSVINELIAGKSLTEACQAADIREEAVKGFFAMPVRTKNTKNETMPDWRSDFMKEIYGDGSAVLSDFNECYDYFKSTLTTEQAKVLVGKFEKKMTFSALGQEMGVSSARIHKLIDELKDILEMILRNRKIYLEKVFSYQEAGRIQTIRKYGQLLKEEYREDGIYVEAYVPTELYAGLMR